ncbi:MAG: T9SS type A sorting domain-containing protein [Lentimicrobiaceae bacterium]|nr:T9SS type A sorting domain-containing protein [Lentimicrobiaceae bacterium]
MLVKKIVLLSSILFLSLALRAQIVLEHTYLGYANVVNLAISGYKYSVFNTQNNTLKLYNTDHSLWKSIALDIPSGYTFNTVQNISETLFNLDNLVEFTYSYYITTTNVVYETKVGNEEGNTLLTIPGAVMAYAVECEDLHAKLLAYIYDYSVTPVNQQTKVYSLPGEIFPVDIPLNSGKNEVLLNACPNPARNYTKISYHFPDAKPEGELILTDGQGRVVKTYHIDNNFDNLIIDTSGFSPGMYLYTISGTSASGKLIIE